MLKREKTLHYIIGMTPLIALYQNAITFVALAHDIYINTVQRSIVSNAAGFLFVIESHYSQINLRTHHDDT